MNSANWASSASIGSWSNVASINLTRTLTNLGPGTTYYFTFRASNATQTIWAAAPLSFTTSAAYAIWASDPAQGLSAGVNDQPGDDPDHDDMTNQQEFAFGLNPTNGSSLNSVIKPLDPATGRFQYSRRAGTGLTYQVLSSTNLQTWARDAGATEVLVTTNGSVQTVTVHVSSAPANGSLFVRVQAQ